MKLERKMAHEATKQLFDFREDSNMEDLGPLAVSMNSVHSRMRTATVSDPGGFVKIFDRAIDCSHVN